MQIADQVVIITGAANGIGRAMAVRFARERPRGLLLTDIDEQSLAAVAKETGGIPLAVDVGRQEEVERMVAEAVRRWHRIDLVCSNAGIETGGGIDASDDTWQRILGVNVWSHLYAAQAALPHMIRQGSGYLLQTVSAAGLLTQMSSLPYSVTKHAALAMAEWLAITYAHVGIRVSCICPLGVRTDMLMGVEDPVATHLRKDAVDPEHVAETAVDGLREERFLILPHAEVAEFFRRKAGDYDRWLAGMQRLRASLPGMPSMATDAPAKAT